MTVNESIGTLIRKRRHAIGMSMPELGEALGVSEQMIQKYETGVSPITVEKLIIAAKAMECSIKRLIP